MSSAHIVRRFPPGSTLGIVGAGQLGRMSAMAARELGYRVHVLDHAADLPASGVADRVVVAPFDDIAACVEFARACDVVTFEFENVPVDTLSAIEAHAPVRPSPTILFTTRHRRREKDFLTSIGTPVARYAPFDSLDQLQLLFPSFGHAIAKTCELGYDGKGQFRLAHDQPIPVELVRMLQSNTEFVLEAVVSFEKEISVIVARNASGQTAVYEPFENHHHDHVLDLTYWPARVEPEIALRAKQTAIGVADALQLVGLLCVEFFVTPSGQVIANELAPRPHNSGHITQNAAITCQFEQHVRAVANLPLGATDPLQPGVMANLLGDLWTQGPPDFDRVLALEPRLKLHLYGKNDPRPGRKMGHVNLLGADAASRLVNAREQLTSPKTPA